MEVEEDLNFRIHNWIKIIVQIKTDITAKVKGRTGSVKASSYDQVQSLNTITEEDAFNIPSCFSLHRTSPRPLGQWWANYGPRARCGPLRGSIRPAADFKI